MHVNDTPHKIAATMVDFIRTSDEIGTYGALVFSRNCMAGGVDMTMRLKLPGAQLYALVSNYR